MDPASRLYIPYFHTSTLAVKHLIWFVGYGIKKHELQGLNCVEPAYAQDAWRKLVEDQQLKDLIQSILDTVGCSPDSLQPANVLKGMNILLRGALGMGKKMVAHAICNMLKHSMFDIRANDIPYLADVQPWAAQPVANVGYNFSVKMIWFSAISSRKHAPVPTVRDTKTWAFL
ncbi:hypothetical protein EV424DRAFT_1350809 [Suillus variegatus]|nr:hypothetical protein EV424DRAFT_1350809 [Suillus variegatus]